MRKLTENHLRAFNAMAAIVERNLLSVESALNRRAESNEIVIRFRDDLLENEREGIRKKLDALRTLLREFRDKYDLPGQTKSLRREVNIHAAFLWEDLAAAADKQLKGYGPVEADLRQEFTAYMEEMARLASQIIKEST